MTGLELMLEAVCKEVDNMEDLKYIIFDGEKIQRHYNDIFNEQGSDLESGYLVGVKICDKEFNVFVSDNEETKESRRYVALGDNQFGTVTVIKALKKLIKFLEMGIDIGFSSNSIE